MTVDWKKKLLPNLPYLLFVYLFDKLCQAVRLAPGLDASEKFLHLSQGFTEAFSYAAPSLHPLDLLVGIAGAVIVRLAVYAKGKNARKYRKGIEYGSARWGTAADIAPYKKRDIWTADMIRTALDQCTDSKLYVAMNLAFACSLRMGEILGLTWSNVHISDEDIADDNAYVYIDKELARASKRAIEMLGQKDIYHVFTPLFPNTSTRIILKKPKTDSSIRKVWLPKTLAYILREWKSAQDELRALLRDEYQDYDLVVALANGRPCEDRIILKSFEKLREKAGLPKVVFHSLRHSSTTYKLKLNHGDLKATQGDTGHAQIDMITSVYAHILDEDRKINAQKFESAFYANPDLRSVRPPEEPKEPAPATLDLEALVEQLRKSPELANTLAALLASAPSEK